MIAGVWVQFPPPAFYLNTMSLKDNIIEKLGICSVCGCAFKYNAVKDAVGQLNTNQEKHICPNCKTKAALDKFREDNKEDGQSS